MPIIRKISRHSACAQITIPTEIVQHLDLSIGEYVVWAIDEKGRVIVDKLTPKNHPGFFVPGIGWLKHGPKK